MRAFFLFLSRQKQLRRWMETSSLAQRVSSRFVAGTQLERALEVTRRICGEGIRVTLDHLGENVTTIEEAAESREEILRALTLLNGVGLEPNISIKLTQFGLDLSESACGDNVGRIVSQAAQLPNGFLRIDMESSEYTDRTLELVRALHAQYRSVGTVIQSYLHRSEADIDDLNRRGIRVRLCKGAYLEPPEVAYPDKAHVDENFVKLMKKLLAEGTYPALATHDERIIDEARRFVVGQKIGPERFEFQMLYGIRRDLQRKLVAEGYRLRLYVPYGVAWYPYFMRRLAERPANVFFLVRNLLRH